MDAKDKERLAKIEERTRGLPEWMAKQSDRVGKLERDRLWLFTLLSAAWAAIGGMLMKRMG